MKQIAELLHLSLNSLHNLLLLTHVIKSLDEFFPINEFLDVEVTEVQKQINFF